MGNGVSSQVAKGKKRKKEGKSPFAVLAGFCRVCVGCVGLLRPLLILHSYHWLLFYTKYSVVTKLAIIGTVPYGRKRTRTQKRWRERASLGWSDQSSNMILPMRVELPRHYSQRCLSRVSRTSALLQFCHYLDFPCPEENRD